MPAFSWNKWAWKVLKTGIVAGGVSIASIIAYDPTWVPALTAILPAKYQVIAANVLIPMAVTGLRNWIKNQGPL